MRTIPSKWVKRIACGMLAAAAVAAGLAVPRPSLAHPTADHRLDDLNRSIQARPNNAALYLRRGEVHRLKQAWSLAEADYLRSRQLDPDLAAADLGLGRMYLESGRPAEALAPLDRYVATRPQDGAAMAIRGKARADRGAYLQAVADFDRAIAAYGAQGWKPQPDLFLDRARSLTAAGDEHAVEALRGLDEGLALLGDAVTIELEAIALELSLGRFDAALARVDQHLDKGRRPGSWLMKRGAILERAGRHAAAAGTYREALEAFESRSASRRSAPAAARRIEEIRTALCRLAGRTNEARQEPRAAEADGDCHE